MQLRRLFSLLCGLLLTSSAHAAVVFDAAANGSRGGFQSGPLDFSITLGSGTKGVIVHLQYDALFSGSVTGVTVGGDALSLISGSSVNASGLFVESWGGSTSTTGSQTVSVAFGTSANIFNAEAVSATGIDTGTPVNNGNSGTNGGRPISLVMTSASGDLSTTLVLHNGVGTTSTNQTLIVLGDRKTTTSNVNPTHTWTVDTIDWTVAVVTGANFKAAAAGSSQAPRSMHQYRFRRE